MKPASRSTDSDSCLSLFAERLVRDQHRVYGYIVSLLGRRSDADEVFQQTCLALWQSAERFDPERDFFAWACGVARHHVHHHQRRRRRDEVSLDADVIEQLAIAGERTFQEVQTGRRDRLDALRSCLEALPDRARQTVERYYLGHAVAAIALEDSLSPAAVYKLLTRTRVRLHRCVQRRMSMESSQ